MRTGRRRKGKMMQRRSGEEKEAEWQEKKGKDEAEICLIYAANPRPMTSHDKYTDQ